VERERTPASSPISCDSSWESRIWNYCWQIAPSTCPALSRLLGPVTAAVVRPPGASRTSDPMDEEGERASWLLLSRAFARCFVRASDASARAKSDCSPELQHLEEHKNPSPTPMDGWRGLFPSADFGRANPIAVVVMMKWDVHAYVAGHHWSNPVT
jgi:hypothetical protein